MPQGRYKKPARSRPQPKLKPVLLGFVAGLVTGLGLGFALYQKKIDTDAMGKHLDKAIARVAGNGAGAAPEPKFEFYTLLPEMEVAVPEAELLAPPASVETATAPESTGQTPKPERYLLQVGSFRKSTEADSFKAELALLGMTPTVQSVTVNGKETWHRVRVGPYTDLTALNQDRQQLRTSGHRPIVLKIRN